MQSYSLTHYTKNTVSRWTSCVFKKISVANFSQLFYRKA